MTPVPGVALADLLGRVDPLAVERRRHADVGDEDLRLGRVGAGDRLVVVRADPDDAEVVVALDERAHALADDEVVVGEEDRDGAVLGRACSVAMEALSRLGRGRRQ